MKHRTNKNEFYAILKNSTVTSGNLTNTTTKQNIGTIKETKTKSTLIACDITVN